MGQIEFGLVNRTWDLKFRTDQFFLWNGFKYQESLAADNKSFPTLN